MKRSFVVGLLLVILSVALIGAGLAGLNERDKSRTVASAQATQAPMLNSKEATFLLFRYLTDWIYGKGGLDVRTRGDMIGALIMARPGMSASYAGDGVWLVQFQATIPLPGPGTQIWRVYDRLAAYRLDFFEPDNELAQALFKYFYQR